MVDELMQTIKEGINYYQVPSKAQCLSTMIQF
jgi:hypothetical protein